MTSDVDISLLPVQAQKVFATDAPAPLRLMAARGVLPGLKPAEIVQVVGWFASSSDEKLRETALATLAKLPDAMLSSALAADLPASTVSHLARSYENRHDVLERLLRMPRIDADTLEYLAAGADEKSGELIATNEELMLAHPKVIEKLYMNKRVRMSTADRLVELAVRHDLELSIPAYKEAALAIKNELISEPTDEPSYDDLLFSEAERVATEVAPLAEDEDAFEVDEEGEEKLRPKFVPLHVLIGQMTITQKIRKAILGNAVERLLLVRDANRLVAQAAVKSPNMRDGEAIQISASRAVSEDVLRIIAQNREFVRHYQVKLNLVSNPRTPLTFAARLLPHLRDNDVRVLTKSKNVSGAIVQAARQQLQRKQHGTKG